MQKSFLIFSPSKKIESVDELIIVPESFSWWAAIFQPLWTLYQKMWLTSLVLIIVITCISLIEQSMTLPLSTRLLIQALLFIYIGLNAHDWKIWSFRQKGYVLHSIVRACNYDEALHSFLASSKKSIPLTTKA